jgi:hypothetical protein
MLSSLLILFHVFHLFHAFQKIKITGRISDRKHGNKPINSNHDQGAIKKARRTARLAMEGGRSEKSGV